MIMAPPKEGEYSVVVIPKEAWENIVRTLEDLKTKVVSLTQKDDDWLDSKTIQEMLGISSRLRIRSSTLTKSFNSLLSFCLAIALFYLVFAAKKNHPSRLSR